MAIFKLFIFLLAFHNSKQDCFVSNATFICENNDVEDIIYNFNSKRTEGIAFTSITIAGSGNTVIDNFIPLLDNPFKENIIELRVINSKVKEIAEDAFEKFTLLKILDVSSNEIEDMTFVKRIPATITELYLSNNSFTNIDDVFGHLKELRILDLSYCNVDEVDFTIFKDIPSLDLVNVSSNCIKKSVSREFVKNIKCVDISHNNLVTYGNIPSFCLDFSYTNISGYRWFNVSEKNTTVLVNKFFYIGNNNLYINATNIHKNLLDIEVNYLNISEFKSNISDIKLSKVKINNELIFKDSNIPLLQKDIYDFKVLFYEKNPNTTLDLSNNSIIDIAELYFEKYDLGILNLCFNAMKHLKSNIFQEAHLGELLLCHSGIETIDDGTFNGLIVNKLNLIHNKIDKLNFLGATAYVEDLNLSYNLIEFININTFSNWTDLKVIDLSNNLIKLIEVGIFNSSKLEIINLRNNNIAVIKTSSFSDLPNLRQLLLEQNPIQIIETNAFNSLPQLIILNLSNMSIEHLHPGSFTDLPQLQILYLNQNNITILPLTVFNNVPNLKHIYLQNNNIHSLKALNGLNLDTLEINIGDEVLAGYFNIPLLKSLHVTDSSLVLSNSYFSGLYNLKEIHLKNSVVIALEPKALRGLFQLEYLDPQVFNKVTVLQKLLFNDLKSLQQLNLCRLNIEVIEPETFSGLIKLATLNLNSNKIVELNDNVFIGLAKVVKLDLSGNSISKLSLNTFVGLDSIKELFLNDNNISSIPLGSLQNLSTLEVLNLADNRIAWINVGTFSGLNKLKYLNLASNQLESLCRATVFPMRNLENLYLSGNLLQRIDYIIVAEDLSKLKVIEFSENNFNCEDVILILRSLENRNVTVYGQVKENYKMENINGIGCKSTCASF